MSEAPGGGGYLPSRWMHVGPIDAGGSDVDQDLAGCGNGSGRSTSFRTSGGPN